MMVYVPADRAPWVAFGRTYGEFYKEGFSSSGVVMLVEGVRGPEEVLVGDVNEQGGGCDCCKVMDDHRVVIKFRLALVEHEDKTIKETF